MFLARPRTGERFRGGKNRATFICSFPWLAINYNLKSSKNVIDKENETFRVRNNAIPPRLQLASTIAHIIRFRTFGEEFNLPKTKNVEKIKRNSKKMKIRNGTEVAPF